VTESGGLRAELLGGGMVLTYLVCLVTTTTEDVHNLLFPLYLDQYGFALTVIGTLSSLLGVMRLASRLPIGALPRLAREGPAAPLAGRVACLDERLRLRAWRLRARGRPHRGPEGPRRPLDVEMDAIAADVAGFARWP
jgi:hypothetical protein